jgi:hypothetical protein
VRARPLRARCVREGEGRRKIFAARAVRRTPEATFLGDERRPIPCTLRFIMMLDELKMQILAQHHFIRALLVNVADLAQRVSEGDASCDEKLREVSHVLTGALLRHMDDEERILGELVLEGHAPAAEHLTEFRHNHLHQRELLAAFEGRVESTHSSRRLGELVEALTHAVALDMEHEEVAILGEGSFAWAREQVRQAL